MAKKQLAPRTQPDDPERQPHNICLPMRSTAGVRVDEDTALTQSTVWACIRVISESLAGMPWRVGNLRDDLTIEPLATHPLNWLLNFEANYETRAFAFRETLWAWALGWGNGYAEIERDNRGDPVALWQLHPSRVRPMRNANDVLIYEVANEAAAPTYLPARNMFHLMGPSPDGLVGWSVIRMHARTIGLAMAQEESASSLNANDSTPGGILTHPARLSDPARKNLEESWKRRHQGPGNRRTVAILEEGLSWQQTGLSPNDSQLLQQMQLTPAMICRIFRVPPHMVADLSRCMPASTLVYTKDGPKSIADVAVGEDVWSFNDRGLALSKVTNRYENGVKELLELATTNRTVRCTATHRLLVRRPFFRELKAGETGGKNVDGRKVRVEWKNVYVQAGDISEGDILVTLGSLPESTLDTAPNGRKLTAEFMEFCGLLIGDGNITKQRGKPSHVAIARSDSASYMDHYRAVAKAEFESFVPNKNYKNTATLERQPVKLIEGRRATKFASVLAAGELTSLGLSGTAFTKRVPAWVFCIAPSLQLAFLRGFLDADGTADSKGRITFYSANKPLIDDMRHLCMGLGIPVTNTRSDINSKPAPSSKSLKLTRMWRFTCSDPGANRRIGSHDKRYIERFSEGKPFGRKDRNYPRFGGSSGIAGMSVAKIVRITPIPAEPTYDIEVEGNHCFIADGVASHNSTNNNIEHQGLEFVQDTLRPWAERGEGEADVKLFGRTNQSRLVTAIDMSERERGDTAARTTHVKEMLFSGVYSINEARRYLGLSGIGPDGDKRFVQSAMVLLEDVGKEPPPAPEPPPPADTPVDTQEMAALCLPVLQDAVKRMLAREKDAERLSGEKLVEWIGRHREHATATLSLAIRPLAACYGAGEESASVAVSLFLDKHLGDFPAPGDPLAKAEQLHQLIKAAASANKEAA